MNLETLLEQPAHRRGWLLIKALECAPLDQAMDLARAADRFIVDGVDADLGSRDPAATATLSTPTTNSDRVDAPKADPPVCAVEIPIEHAKPSRLPLVPRQREELLGRAATGANNAELAVEFGLTPRQVQGLRMGASRVSGRRRAEAPNAAAPMVSATQEEVVRYLRQQDDVVVSDGDGGFLVNGRFRLGLAELVAKANRARARQNKALFQINGLALDATPDVERNGHAQFRMSAIGDSH
jgi:hypothetical protein